MLCRDQIIHCFVDALGHERRVHGVEVDAVDILADQIDDLIDSVGDAGVAERHGIVFVAVDHLYELLGKLDAAEFHHALDLLFIRYRHDAGLDGDVDACDRSALTEVVEVTVIEEELGNEVVRPGIDLILQVVNIIHHGGCLDVAFGVAGSDDIEVSVFANEGDQLVSVFEFAAGHDRDRDGDYGLDQNGSRRFYQA